MTSTAAATDPVSAPPATVHIVVVGLLIPTAEALHAALVERTEHAAPWHVHRIEAASPRRAEIVLCDGASGAPTARTTWPSATVVALVPVHDDGRATIAAMDAGAHVCVRGDNPALISAYLQSIARRRGLLPREAI